jgi:hypothetical protein
VGLQKDRQQLLLLILIASIISTFVHYTDNFFFFEQYPQPEWITLSSIYISWLLLTAIGIAGYRLYSSQQLWFSYLCLFLYSLTGLSSLGHYFYGNLSRFSAKMNLFIWADGLTGLAVLLFTFWSGLILKEWMSKSLSR